MHDIDQVAVLIDNFKTAYNATYSTEQDKFIAVRSALSDLLSQMDTMLINLDIYDVTDNKLLVETIFQALIG